jgi:hypothetical protein
MFVKVDKMFERVGWLMEELGKVSCVFLLFGGCESGMSIVDFLMLTKFMDYLVIVFHCAMLGRAECVNLAGL